MAGKGGALRIHLTDRVVVEAGGTLEEGALQRQARLVLAMLAAEAGRPVAREQFAEALWPDAVPARWERLLAALVTRVRTALETVGLPREAIRSSFGAYELTVPEHAWIDVAGAEDALQRAEGALADGGHAGARAAAGEAAEIARREFLPGEDGHWVARKRLALRQTLVRALDVLTEAALALDDPRAAVAAAEEVVALEPFRESGSLRLMRAYVAAGDRAEALRVYERCRALLAEELGVDPGHEIEELYLRILRSEPAGSAATPRATDVGRRLATVLFTDIVDSTSHVARLGDAAWRRSLEDHDRIARDRIEASEGRMVKSMGDGLLAVFRAPAQAIRCASEIRDALRERGFEIRAGLHAGEVELTEDDVIGIAVHLAQRVLESARPGEILMSRTVADLAAGSGVTVANRGTHEFRGVPGRWALCSAETEAATATPQDDAVPVSFPPEDRATAHLVGRDADIATLTRLVREQRLVTIIGPGGVGKTTLATAVAERLTADLGRPVVTVELAPVTDEPGVISALALAAGVTRPDPSIEDVREILADSASLLVLDNCEHVLDSAARIAGAVLQARPGPSVLATSRELLRLQNEHVWRAEPLVCPEDPTMALPEAISFPAVQLFALRARAANSAFSLNEQNLDDVVAICRALDGLPLAIELAAARARVLAPADIRKRLSERLDFFTASHRETAARQQTIRALLDWSYDLLAPEDHRFFARMGVFAGAWTLEAAAAICGIGEDQALEMISTLVDASLIEMVVTDDRTTRYRMLETVRAYALDRLQPELDEIRTRHAAWYGQRYSADRRLDDFDIEKEDLRSALDVLIQTQPELAIEVLSTSSVHWTNTGLAAEAARLIERLKDNGIESADLFRLGGFFSFKLGRAAETKRYYDLMLERGRADGTDLVSHLIAYGSWLYQIGQGKDSIPIFQEAGQLAEAQGRPLGLVRALHREGDTRASLGDREEGEIILRRALAVAEEHGFTVEVALVHASLARACQRTGQPREGFEHIQHALELLRSLDEEPSNTANTLNVAMMIAWELDEHDLLDAFAEESLRLVERIDNVFQKTATLSNLGYLASKRSDLRRARELLNQSLTIKKRAGLPTDITLQALTDLALTVRDPNAALRSVDEALRASERGGWAQVDALWLLKAKALLHSGDLEGCRSILARPFESPDPEHSLIAGWVAIHDGALDTAEAAFARLDGATMPMEYRLEIQRGRAQIALTRGDGDGAASILRRIVEEAVSVPQIEHAIEALPLLAREAFLAGHPARAARLLGGAERARETYGIGIAPIDQPAHDQLEQDLARALGRSALEQLWAEGRGMSEERLIAYARAPSDAPD